MANLRRLCNHRVFFTELVLCAFLCDFTVLYAEASLLKSVTTEDPTIVYSKPFITVENTLFGAKIEGTSVDSQGRVYAVDFGSETPQFGQLSNADGEVEQKLFFKWKDSKSYFNGIRFYPVPVEDKSVVSTALLADKLGQVFQVLESKEDGAVSGRVFCSNKSMIEPNDVAVSYSTGRVYASGLNYADTTTFGDGQLWLCETASGEPLYSTDLGKGPVATNTLLRTQGRANGLEVSNDEKYLYAAETWAKDKKIYSNVLWRFDLDPQTGLLSNKHLFFDMKPVDEELKGTAGDIDGVRTDMAGNLFLVRNGEPGEVVKVSAAGKIVQRIKLPGITEPTNIELAGPEGKTLFIVGKCRETKPDGVQVGCINKWEGNDAPGRAFFNLVRPGYPHDEL